MDLFLEKMVGIVLILGYVFGIPWLYYKYLATLRQRGEFYCLMKIIFKNQEFNNVELKAFIILEKKRLKKMPILFCSKRLYFFTKPLICERYILNADYNEILIDFENIQIKLNKILLSIVLVFASIVFTIEYMGEGADLLFNFIYPMIK